MEVRMSDDSSPSALPDRPSLEQLRKQAKQLHASGDHPSLAAAQRWLARRYVYASWPKLKFAVELAMLRRAITEGDTARVRELLESSPKLASGRFAEGDTPLHHAAGENRADV